MRVCPKCGFRESPFWKPLFWNLYWDYMSEADFFMEYPGFEGEKRLKTKLLSEDGSIRYDFEDSFYYYKFAGKTRKIIHRFPKGFESMANRKLFEKTPSEKKK